MAARACLSSPTCLNALRMGGTTVVAKVAALLTPDDLLQIPGFGAGSQPNPSGPTTTPGTAIGTPGGNVQTYPAGSEPERATAPAATKSPPQRQVTISWSTRQRHRLLAMAWCTLYHRMTEMPSTTDCRGLWEVCRWLQDLVPTKFLNTRMEHKRMQIGCLIICR